MAPIADPIRVVTGRDEGTTELDAFDAALADAGIADYNLLTLSSVVPPGTAVRAVDGPVDDWETGTPVGVVLARRSTAAETRIAAGLGWVLADEGGVFYETTGTDAGECRRELRRGLRGARGRRDWNWHGDGVRSAVVEFVPDDPPGAAVAAAVYGPLATDDR